jgi:hypothetical protein
MSKRKQGTRYQRMSADALEEARRGLPNISNPKKRAGHARAIKAAEANIDPAADWCLPHPDARKPLTKPNAILELLRSTFGDRWLVLIGYLPAEPVPEEKEQTTRARERHAEERVRSEFRDWETLLARRVVAEQRAGPGGRFAGANRVAADLINRWRDVAENAYGRPLTGWAELASGGSRRVAFQAELGRAIYDATRRLLTPCKRKKRAASELLSGDTAETERCPLVARKVPLLRPAPRDPTVLAGIRAAVEKALIPTPDEE